MYSGNAWLGYRSGHQLLRMVFRGFRQYLHKGAWTRLGNELFFSNHFPFIHESSRPSTLYSHESLASTKHNRPKDQVSKSKSGWSPTVGGIYYNESKSSRMPQNLFARSFTGQVQRSEQTIKATGVCKIRIKINFNRRRQCSVYKKWNSSMVQACNTKPVRAKKNPLS